MATFSASSRLTLGRAARVVGNIQAPRLIIEDGAILEGSCSMVKSIEAQEQRIAESQKQVPTPSFEEPEETVDEFETSAIEISDQESIEEPDEPVSKAAVN